MFEMNAFLLKHYANQAAHRSLRHVIAVSMYYLALLFFFFKKSILGTNLLLRSHRIMNTNLAQRLIAEKVLRLPSALQMLITTDVFGEESARRTIVLKWPDMGGASARRRGIMLIKFTRTFGYFHLNVDIQELARYFHIVLEPSWAGYADPNILAWANQTNEPIYVQSSEITDRVFLNCLDTNLIPLSIGASDWVDHHSFSPAGLPKIYDSIYVANLNPIKRTIRYMQAIRRLCKKDPEYRGVLVCAEWGGGDEKDIMRLVQRYGIAENLSVMFSLDNRRLCQVIDQSKVSILLSLKEGSNKTLFESMFINVPVICLAENTGVNKGYINEYTGKLIDDYCLEKTLLSMKNRWEAFQPRKWAMKNISPSITTMKLLELIGNNEGIEIDPSTVLVKVNNPEFAYLAYSDLEYLDLNMALLDCFTKGGLGHVDPERIDNLRDVFERRLNASRSNASVTN